MLHLLKRMNDGIARVLQGLLVLLMGSMSAIIFIQVIYRYLLRSPLSWSEELSRYLFSSIIFFGAVLLYRESKHINMSIVVDSIKNTFVRQSIIIIAHLFSVFFLVVMLWYSFPMALQILEFEVASPSMEWLKMGHVFLIVPVASLISFSMMLEVVGDSLIKLKGAK